MEELHANGRNVYHNMSLPNKELDFDTAERILNNVMLACGFDIVSLKAAEMAVENHSKKK